MHCANLWLSYISICIHCVHNYIHLNIFIYDIYLYLLYYIYLYIFVFKYTFIYIHYYIYKHTSYIKYKNVLFIIYLCRFYFYIVR